MILSSNQPTGQGKEAENEEEETTLNLPQKFSEGYSVASPPIIKPLLVSYSHTKVLFDLLQRVSMATVIKKKKKLCEQKNYEKENTKQKADKRSFCSALKLTTFSFPLFPSPPASAEGPLPFLTESPTFPSLPRLLN